MFYTNYERYCMLIGESPTAVAAAIGLKSSGTMSGWKAGAVPRPQTVKKLVDYFNEHGVKCEVADLFYDEDGEMDSFVESTRENLFSNPRMRLLFDAASGATDADLLEAAALLERRKEERNR